MRGINNQTDLIYKIERCLVCARKTKSHIVGENSWQPLSTQHSHWRSKITITSHLNHALSWPSARATCLLFSSLHTFLVLQFIIILQNLRFIYLAF